MNTPARSTHDATAALAEAASLTADANVLLQTLNQRVDIWKIETQFKGADKYNNLTLKVAPKSKKGKFSVTIPARGTTKKTRSEIVFGQGGNEGLSRAFGEYIFEEMKKVIAKWSVVRSQGHAQVGGHGKEQLEATH